MKNHVRKLVNILVVIVMLQATVFSVFAATPQPPKPVGTPPTSDGLVPQGQKIGLTDADRTKAAQLKLSGLPIDTLDANLVTVSIRATMPAFSEKAKGLSEAERLAYKAQVEAFQAELETSIVANGGKVIYRYRTLSSGVIADVPGNQILRLAQLPIFEHISRIFDFQANLTETVPFIGANALKELGVKGDGVKVAVLDSGIDYSHLAFGGSANPALWLDAYYGSDPACLRTGSTAGQQPQCAANKAVDPAFAGLFGPLAPKVKGGYDWVGPVWPNGALAPDPNPIGLKGGGYHGTHVADIIAGYGYPAGSYDPDGEGPLPPVSYSAKGEGVAPAADLYAFTVCSQITTSCAGVSLLQAVDDAADLDDNPATVDPADVLNMSLGSPYGQPEDDLTYLTNQIVAYGTIAAVSAGNNADLPFIVGSPSIASGAISVAQTEVPSGKQYRIVVNSPPAIAGDLDAPAIHSWSAQYYTQAITADIVYDNTSAATKIGCKNAAGAIPDEWVGQPTRFAGKIVLVDRGSCSASLKVANAQAAGASMVLIAMIAAGPGYPFAYGGGAVSIPSFSITQADGNKLKSTVTPPMPAQVVTLANAKADPNVYISLANTIVQTSSRGPRNHDNKIKPDIGAPGASVSAEAGTGAGSTGFGGTSGASPMVAGSAALLKSLFGDQQNFIDPQLTVQEYKAMLMNTANNKIYENRTPSNPTGVLLPVTRIGAGQVNLEHALKSQLLAVDVTDASVLEHTGSMSFQYVAAKDVTSVTHMLHIRNLSGIQKFVNFTSEFRYASDDTGAITVTPSVPSATIPAQSAIDVKVTVKVDPSKLTPWFDWANGWLVDRGYFGGNGAQFKLAEFDGYFYINEVLGGSVTNSISVPWQVLPKPVADVTMEKDPEADELVLTNPSTAVTSNADLFYLVDVNPNDYNYTIGDCSSVGSNPGCNQSPVDLKEVGVRGYVIAPGAPQDVTADYAYIDFGITIWDNPYRAGPMVPEFDIYVDSTGDGVPDYIVYNADYGYAFTGTFSGQQVVIVYNLTKKTAVVRYYLDSTVDSNNFIFPVKASDLGLSQTNLKFKFFVLAFDWYFGGSAWDASPQKWDFHQVDLLNPRWSPETLMLAIDPDTSASVAYTLNNPGSWVGSGSQVGFLAMYREAPVQHESSHVVLDTTVPRNNVVFVPLVSLVPEAMP